MASAQSATADNSVPLHAIIITEELKKRAARPPNEAALNEALVFLAQTMANSPERILQHLVDTALTLCQAQSAGISLLEEEEGHQIFRWHALAGQYASHVWGTTPRDFSPCGTVLDTDSVQLMSRLDRHFRYFAEVTPLIEEALLIPFHVGSKAVGTIWVLAHDQSRGFDKEDVRVMDALGEFAAAAYQVVRSLTALKGAVAQAEQANRDLLQSNQELKRVEAGYRLMNTELEQFALAASHDLEEPLRTITAYTQLLHHKIHANLDPDNEKLFERITSGAARMKSLIDNLLEYSRLGQDRAGTFRPISLGDVLANVLADLDKLIADQQVRITHNPLPTIHANRAQITLLLQNLIVNSIKYRRKEEAPQIHLAAERGEGCWEISVRDNGEGFSEQYSERIFGPFKRLHGTDVPGTGMGLALCQKIVQRHGGTIRAKSIPGEGSTFSFTIAAETN
jgi:signal transduction histidine kinase